MVTSNQTARPPFSRSTSWRRNRRFLAAAALAVAISAPLCARADEALPASAARVASPPAQASEVPRVHHAPRVTAQTGEDVTIGAVIERVDKVKRALLVYDAPQAHGEIEFQRSSDAALPYVAVIPASVVRGPMLSYAIELETTDGSHLPVFASRANPHPVTVLDAAQDVRAAAVLTRLGGRRSVVQTGGEYVDFGRSEGEVTIPPTNGAPARTERRSVRDEYYRVEGAYTYRLLGIVSEFGMRAGVVRGNSLVKGEIDPSKYEVGLNYGAPRVRVRIDDWLHVEGELLISVTEVGFSTGGGGAVLLGDAYGSKLVLGAEGISIFGARGYTRLDIVASERWRVSPMIEVSNMPHADRAGVRLLGEIGVGLGAGFRLDVRGGYQARTFERGGPTIGGGLAYAF
jgi:hypothetical protein